MGAILKPLGQSNPGTTLTDLYTVPAVTQTTTSSLIFCNKSSSGRTLRVAVRSRGAEIQDYHYIYYDFALAANHTHVAVLGLTLESADVVSVYGSTTDVIFSLYGVETS